MKRIVVGAIVLGACGGVLAMSGCRVESDNHGDHKNVKIATPFGGVDLKTNDAVSGLGLPVYPGAELVKKKGDDKDDGAADVNLHFGDFQLRVKAAGYQSADATDKVTAFYRKALERYGDVLECHDGKPAGAITHTAEGLTCEDDKGEHSPRVSMKGDISNKMELKAGSKLHQHIVAIDTEGSGSKFGIIALDLPGHLPFTDNDKNGKQ